MDSIKFICCTADSFSWGRMVCVVGSKKWYLIVFDFSSDSKKSGVNICNNSNISNNSDMRGYDEEKSSDVDCIKEVFNLRRFNIIVNRTEISDWFINSESSSYHIGSLSYAPSFRSQKRNQSPSDINNFLLDYAKVSL